MKIGYFLLSGLFLMFGNTLVQADSTTHGYCSPIVAGENNRITVTCSKPTIPRPALDSLEKRLEQYLQENFKLVSTAEDAQKLIFDLQQQVDNWAKRYHELAASNEGSLLKEPNNSLFKYAKIALENGDFENVAKLYQNSARDHEEQTKKIEILKKSIGVLQEKESQTIDLSARDRFNAGTAYELNFQPIVALKEYAKAYKHRPDNFNYAFQYAWLSQKQNQRRQAEDVYSKLIDSVRKTKPLDEEQLGKLTMLLNNLANLVADDTQRRAEAEEHYNEALTIRRKLAEDNPQVYLPDVAMTLNNLANLVGDDTQRRSETEEIYNEALENYRKLVKHNSRVYLPYVATTLNNLANLVADDTQRRREAEKLYKEALDTYRKLEKHNSRVYLPYVSAILNNLATLAGREVQRRREAEKLYKEALTIRRKLARDNPQVYLPYVSATLNNLANLTQGEAQRRREAEKLYNEALNNYRKLAKHNPQVYLPDVAMTLNNLAVLVKGDTQRRAETEKLYNEALNNYRKLAKHNPQVYLPDVAMTLNNIATLVGDDTQRRAEAEERYNEALTIRRKLAKHSPQVHLPDVAATLNNLAILISSDTQRQAETEKLYNEALGNYRKLAKHNPRVYSPYVATTLGAFGQSYLRWELPNKAKPLLREAAQILSPFAKQSPTVFGDKQAGTLLLAAQADLEDIAFVCAAMTEAAKVAQNTDLKAEVIETSNLYCKTESN